MCIIGSVGKFSVGVNVVNVCEWICPSSTRRDSLTETSKMEGAESMQDLVQFEHLKIIILFICIMHLRLQKSRHAVSFFFYCKIIVVMPFLYMHYLSILFIDDRWYHGSTILLDNFG